MTMGTPYWAVRAEGNGVYSQEPDSLHVEDVDCVEMDATRFLYYNDEDCRALNSVICEKNSDIWTTLSPILD